MTCWTSWPTSPLLAESESCQLSKRQLVKMESGGFGPHFFYPHPDDDRLGTNGRVGLSFRKQFVHAAVSNFFYTRTMNQSMVRNLCRKAAVVGGKCADRHADSIASAAYPKETALLRSIGLVVMRAMADRLSSVFPGEFHADTNAYLLKQGDGCFRFIPFLELHNARRNGASIGAACSFHGSTANDAVAPLCAAAYLGDRAGVLHASSAEVVVRSNYRRIPRPSFPQGVEMPVSPVVGIGTDENWENVPHAIHQLIPALRHRPYLASPLLVAHAMVTGSLDAAIIQTADERLHAMATFFLDQAEVPCHALHFNGEGLIVRSWSPVLVGEEWPA